MASLKEIHKNYPKNLGFKKGVGRGYYVLENKQDHMQWPQLSWPLPERLKHVCAALQDVFNENFGSVIIFVGF